MEVKINDQKTSSPLVDNNPVSPILLHSTSKPNEDNKKPEESFDFSLPPRKSSSSSDESLSDKELKFDDVELNLGDVSLALAPSHRLEASRKHNVHRLGRLFNQIEQSSAAESARDPAKQEDEGWARLFSEANMKTTTTTPSKPDESVAVKIFDLATMSYIPSPSKELAMSEYRTGKELVVELTNYKVEDVTYLIRELNLNAILCWEILGEQSPDKFEKFGSRAFFTFLNFLTVESIGSSQQHSVKIVKVPRLILLFNSGKFEFNDLAPKSIENLTSDKILFLIFQYSMQQVEDVLSALKVHANSIYRQTHEASNGNKTKYAPFSHLKP